MTCVTSSSTTAPDRRPEYYLSQRVGQHFVGVRWNRHLGQPMADIYLRNEHLRTTPLRLCKQAIGFGINANVSHETTQRYYGDLREAELAFGAGCA